MLRQLLWDACRIGEHFGLRRGLKLKAEIEIKNWRGRLFSIQIPSLAHPIWIRPKTSDVSAFYQIFIDMEYCIRYSQDARVTRRYIELAASQSPLILDCGANIGLSAVWFANLFPQARILAIEPDAGNIEVLRKNVAPYKNVEVVPGAVWDSPRHLAIKNPDAEAWMFRVKENEDGSIRAYTVNELSDGGDIFIAKVDIEGAEEVVFRRNTEWLQKTDMLVIELHDWLFPGSRTSKNCIQQIAQSDFDFFVHGENLFFLFRC